VVHLSSIYKKKTYLKIKQSRVSNRPRNSHTIITKYAFCAFDNGKNLTLFYNPIANVIGISLETLAPVLFPQICTV
jgi:hypothetical protein